MTGARRALGDHGEECVAKWYLANGYEIVARNFEMNDATRKLCARNLATPR